MAQRKTALGRGVDALIPGSTDGPKAKKSAQKTTAKPEIKMVEQMIKITDIEPNKDQPRKKFDEDKLEELAESIKQFGIVEPLVVIKRNKFYELIAGERRWRAAKLAGLKEVPVVIKDYNDQEIVEIALIENIQREDLNPIEEAFAYKRLMQEFNLTQEQVAERVSKGRTAITNSIRLLKLCDKVQQMVIDEMLSAGHVRALVVIEDEQLQYEAAQYIFDNELTVRETESYVKKLNAKKDVPNSNQKQPLEDISFLYKEIETNLKDILGTKVSIKAKSKNKGKIEIEYFSEDDLERIKNSLYSIK